MKLDDIPIMSLGPGSQPVQAGDELEFMPFPEQMQTYRAPVLPETLTLADCPAAARCLEALQALLDGYGQGAGVSVLDMHGSDAASLSLVDQVLGEGEVSVRCTGTHHARAQESILAGVWRVEHLDAADRVLRTALHVGEIPGIIQDALSDYAGAPGCMPPEEISPGVGNATAVLVELREKADRFRPGGEAHVVNLTLLPFSPEDNAYLQRCLGSGPVTLLSRGFGNCRITSTAMKHVWWVQYFNSMDTLILNTLEVTEVPAVACAAPEDLADSAMRLRELVEDLK